MAIPRLGAVISRVRNLFSTTHIDRSVRFESRQDRTRLSPGVVIIGDVLIKEGTTIGPNTLIQAFPGKKLVLGGEIGENCTIQARKEDSILTGGVRVAKGAFVKDLQLKDMAAVDFGAYSEVKKVESQAATLTVGERAFFKNRTVHTAATVPAFSRFDGEQEKFGQDVFTSHDRGLARNIRSSTDLFAAEAALRTHNNVDSMFWRVLNGTLKSVRNVLVGSNVRLAKGNTIYSGVRIIGDGEVEIGEGNTFYPGVTIFAKKGKKVVIGAGNTFFPNTMVVADKDSVAIGSNNEELGIGGGALIVDSLIGNHVFLVGNPIISNTDLRGWNFVFRSLLHHAILWLGQKKAEIEVKSNCVLIGHLKDHVLVKETIPECSREEMPDIAT
ncbi:hypothetical protein ACFL5U_00300 [Candidatus Margulisiibacteriota bacterium]